MDSQISKDATAVTLVATALGGRSTDTQAEQLAALHRILQKLAWLVAAQRIAAQVGRRASTGGDVAAGVPSR